MYFAHETHATALSKDSSSSLSLQTASARCEIIIAAMRDGLN
jgi:hypothetical protein